MSEIQPKAETLSKQSSATSKLQERYLLSFYSRICFTAYLYFTMRFILPGTLGFYRDIRSRPWTGQYRMCQRKIKGEREKERKPARRENDFHGVLESVMVSLTLRRIASFLGGIPRHLWYQANISMNVGNMQLQLQIDAWRFPTIENKWRILSWGIIVHARCNSKSKIRGAKLE